MTADKAYMSLEEVAETLGVTYQLIYRLVRSGELPASRLGKLYRVSRRDLNHYLESSKQVGSTGGTCAACGKTYASRLSLTQTCTVASCAAPICNDCWTRRRQHVCREHAAK
jgi:excisionase family DNA binding protein